VVSVISEQEYITRIAALERVNKSLAEQVDRMAKVVDAACYWYSGQSGWSERLAAAVSTYEQQMAEMAKGGINR
jgi:hypothetical protein